jgi:hypothetical protein
MAFSDFDLRKALTDFSLTVNEDTDLFAAIPTVEPSEFLRNWLAEFVPVALGIGSERGRSEAIIFPILAEAKRRSPGPVMVAPGVTFDVDKSRGLTGVCDYLLARSREVFFVKGPVFAAVEAKKEDIVGGLGQCAAEMVAIRIFNEREKTVLPAVFGCVTSGNLWRFLKLEADTLFIDKVEYYLRDVPKLLGILVHIADTPRP